MKYLSFFSGALGLDLGLEKAGLEPLLFCEKDKSCRETIHKNKPDIPLIDNILNYSKEDILSLVGAEKKIDVIVGGPPCQAFSTAGARNSFDDERGNVFLRFIALATSLNPNYIVMENVRGILSAAYSPKTSKKEKGTALEYVVFLLEKSGYSVSFNLYNSANFGVPQVRERVVIVASKSRKKFPYLVPTHSKDGSFGLDKWLTVKDAIHDIPSERNSLRMEFSEKTKRLYRYLKSGQYWKDLPIDLQKEALGKAFFLGGGKTGFMRRLDWNKPSPTLVTSPIMPATSLAHPEEDRPLSIAEYARIQQFPDDWYFGGSLQNKYRQIGNAVPLGLGEAIGKSLVKHNRGEVYTPPSDFPFSRYKFTTEKNWMLGFKKKTGQIDMF